MSNKLENFLNDNKDEFDSYEPSDAMWSRIENRISQPEKKGLLVSLGARRWMSAAAAVVVIAGATFLFTRKNGTTITTTGPEVAVVPSTTSGAPDPLDQTPSVAQVDPKKDQTYSDTLKPIHSGNAVLASHEDQLQNIASEELVHYTKLVELKQQQITILKKDEPLLYKQFASDFEKIDNEFIELKKQKQLHPNSEQLLEAMLQNLRMQSALLNRQLEIVKSINNNKKKRYEKTYNSTL